MSLNNSDKTKLFVLYTKPNHELKVSDNLLKIGIKSCCPVIISNRIWSDRIKKVKEVIIKSIVFVRCDLKERNSVFDIPSTIRYLFYCNKPAIILDNETKKYELFES